MATDSTGTDPRPPTGGELCDEPYCSSIAHWAFSVMGHHPRAVGRAIFCEQHAEFYRRQGPSIYPASQREATR